MVYSLQTSTHTEKLCFSVIDLFSYLSACIYITCKVFYYFPSRDIPKILPYIFDQIQLVGLKIPYYSCTVCKGKRNTCLEQKTEPCILLFRFETRLTTSIIICFRIKTRFMPFFTRLYQRNVIFASIKNHMQFVFSLYADIHTQCAIWLSESAEI